METQRAPQRPTILDSIDTYLGFHNDSEAARRHVVAVLTKYDHMVSLAADRALESLYVPDNVIQFPTSRTTPEAS